MEQIHAHTVLNMLIENGKDIKIENLKDLINKELGHKCFFKTCSKSGLDVDDLLTFFENMGKIKVSNGVISMINGCGCGH